MNAIFSLCIAGAILLTLFGIALAITVVFTHRADKTALNLTVTATLLEVIAYVVTICDGMLLAVGLCAKMHG